MRLPPVSFLLIPFQLALRLIAYFVALCVAALAAWISFETVAHLYDLLQRTVFKDPWLY